MRYLLYIVCIILLSPATVAGQANHVPNGSFEYYTTCPATLGQVTGYCTGWYRFTSATCDYYSSCNSGSVGVPNNFIGYQPAASGNAYCGLIAHITPTQHFEYLATPIQPLIKGAAYEVSMSVNLGNSSVNATGNIGAYFFDAGPATINTNSILQVIPQVYYANQGIITDSVNWTRLSKVFVADSAYDNIVIGGFLNNLQSYPIDTLQVVSGNSYAYYYIDSVVVKLYDSLFLNNVDTMLCAGDTISVSYLSTIRKKTNNTFTLQLSNSSGSFASPVNIGSLASDTSGTITGVIPSNTTTGTGYRIRIVASDFADTSYESVNIKIGNSTIAQPSLSSNSPVCNGNTLMLTASSTTSGVSYKWSGPGGFNTQTQNPSLPNASPANSGNYIATAYIYGCEASDSVSVIINPNPANFTTTSNSPVCEADSIRFTASSTSTGVSYSWSGPGSFLATGPTPGIANASAVHAGSYSVTATLNGCSATNTIAVAIKPTPAKPVATGNGPLCAGDTLKLTSFSSTTGVVYNWTGPGNFTSTTPNPVINNTTTASAGSYIVSALLNGCGRKDTVVVVIHPAPTPVTISSNSPVCEGDTLHLFSTSSSTGVSYNWSGPNNFTASAKDSFVANCTMAASGWYTMTVSINSCSYIDSLQAMIRHNPVINPPNLSYKSPICVGDTLHLSTAAVQGATYNWVGPGGFSSGLQNPKRPNIQLNQAGIYNLTLTKDDCVSPPGGVYVLVNPQPEVNIITIPPDSICDRDSFVISALSNCHFPSTQYTWYVNHSVVTSGNIATYLSTNLKDKDIVYCRITESTWCQYPFTKESNHITLSLLPTLTPSVSITANGLTPFIPAAPVTFTATVANGGATPVFKWKLNGQDVKGVTGDTWVTTTLNDNDIVSVEIESNYKCPLPRTATSNRVRIRATSINDLPEFGKIALYPNPNNGKFIISSANPVADDIRYEILNALGQVVYKGMQPAQQSQFFAEVDIPGATPGIYQLRLHTKNSVHVLRFTVNN